MKYYFEILKKFNDFHGRASRDEFRHFALIHIAIVCVLYFLGYATDHPFAIKVIDTVSGLFVVGTLLSVVALFVRRLKTLGRDPKILFAALVPVAGLIYLMAVCLKNENAEKSSSIMKLFKGLAQKFPKRQHVL